MKNIFLKQNKAIVLLLVAVMLFANIAGCSNGNGKEQHTIKPEELPASPYLRARLYFPEGLETDKGYVDEWRELPIPTGRSIEWVLVDALREGPQADWERLLPAHATSISQAYVLDDVLYIDLNYDASADDDFTLSASDILRFRTAAMLTVSPMTGAKYCVVRVNNMIFPGIPIGIANSTLAGRTSDFQAIKEPTKVTQRHTLLYFNYNDEYAVPKEMDIEMANDEKEFIEKLLKKLSSQPDGKKLLPSLPSGIRYIKHETKSTEGLRTLSVSLSGEVEFSELSSVCFALSILQNVSGIHAVSIQYNGQQKAYHTNKNNETSTYFTVNQLDHYIADTVPLYFMEKSGRFLLHVNRIIPKEYAKSRFYAIEAMLSGPSSADGSDALPIVPSGILPQDLLSAKVYGNMVALNFSKNFYEKCATLSQDGERALVYAIVNAATERDGITSVLFLKDGEHVQKMSKEIVLLKPLYRNPGLVK